MPVLLQFPRSDRSHRTAGDAVLDGAHWLSVRVLAAAVAGHRELRSGRRLPVHEDF